MNKGRYIVLGVAIFVYTLAVIGLTTWIVLPNPNEQPNCECVEDGASARE